MKRKYKFCITAEIVLLNLSFILIFAIVISYGSRNIFSKGIKQQMETLIADTCHIAKEYIDGNSFKEYLDTKGQSDNSLKALQTLQTICDSTEFNYIYIIVPDLDNQKVKNILSVHGSMYPNLAVYDVGKVSDIITNEFKIAYRKIMDGEKDIEFVYRIVPGAKNYRDHITGLSPVSDSTGKIVGIICAEATLAWYKSSINHYMKSFLLWLIIMIILVIAGNNLLLQHRIVIPILRIKKETERFAHDITIKESSLSSKVNRNNELGQLANSIDLMENQTMEFVKNITNMAVEKERNETQLHIASAIQLGSLPKPLNLKTVDLYATMKPALEVGGDFYDFFMIDENHVGLVIADVSGKGIPAALFMMASKIILKKNLKNKMSPAKVLHQTNLELCEKNPAEMFVTCLCGILNLNTNELTLANAGHEKPAIYRNGDVFTLADTKPSLVLGSIPEIQYKDEVFKLYPGDIIFTYTDGIPEAVNLSNEQFGNARMLEVLNNSKNKTVEDICIDIQQAVINHANSAAQFDDITMLALKIK